MIQLDILYGKTAGASTVARRFPFVIGRSAGAHLRLEEDGVWEQHLSITLQSPDGFLLRTHPGALTSLNGKPVEQTVLRNGDLIEIGSAQILFSLSPAAQSDLRLREAFTWLLLLAVTAAQIALIYWLPK